MPPSARGISRRASADRTALSLASLVPPRLEPALTNAIHHFAYQRDPLSEDPGLHELRDGDAFTEIHAALQNLDYRFGGLHINNPVDPDIDALPPWDSSDVVVLTTRPPLDDHAEMDRRHIARTLSRTEREILRHVRPCFATCKRMLVQLSRKAVEHLGPYADRGLLKFRLNKKENRSDPSRAVYHKRRDPYARRSAFVDDPVVKTAAFLLVRHIEPNGPRLVVAFGMDGILTLTWCYLLRTRFPHLLTAPRFVMAEISLLPIPKQPTSLSFADDWRVDTILDISPDLLDPPPADYTPPW